MGFPETGQQDVAAARADVRRLEAVLAGMQRRNKASTLEYSRRLVELETANQLLDGLLAETR
jgi:hypothetical protein